MRDWRDDPRIGMVIVERNPRHRRGRIAREIIGVDGDRIETAGKSGAQRNRWMGRKRLRRYDLASPPTHEEAR